MNQSAATKTNRIRRILPPPEVCREVIRHILPTVPAAILPTLSVMADAWFLSRLGADACAAVGILFPVHAVIQTVGFVAGTGGGSLTARALGAGDRDRALGLIRASLFWAVALTVLLAVPGLAFRRPLLALLGAAAETAELALPYLVCLLLSAPLMCGVCVLSNLVRFAGHTVLSLVGIAVGTLLTVALDPLFIFTLGLGLTGAGLVLPVAYGSAFGILLIGLYRAMPGIRLLPRSLSASLRFAGRSAIHGLPSLFRQGLTVLAVLLTNRAARGFGPAALASIAISSRIFLILYGFCLGIGQGMLPCAGSACGRGERETVRSVFRLSLLLASAVSLIVSVPVLLFAPQIVGWFRDDPEIVRCGTALLRAQSAVLILHAFIAPTNLLLQAVGRPASASLIAAARQGFCFLPLILILPRQFGFCGIVLAQPVADGLTFLLTLPFLFGLLRGSGIAKSSPISPAEKTDCS